jgi:hypothetical protein
MPIKLCWISGNALLHQLHSVELMESFGSARLVEDTILQKSFS